MSNSKDKLGQQNINDLTTILFFLYGATRDGVIYQGYDAYQAFDAFCRIMKIDKEVFVKNVEKGMNISPG